MLFVVLSAVGVKPFGANLSIFVTFPTLYPPAFVPSHNLAYTFPFVSNSCIAVFFQLASTVGVFVV